MAGAASGNNFNVSCSGVNANLYIDNTDFDTIQTTSDYRLKKNVSSIKAQALQRVKKLRPVFFEYKNISGDLYSTDLKVHEGFITHEYRQ